MNDIGLDCEVVTYEFCRTSRVGVDAAYFGGSEENKLRLVLGKEAVDRRLIGEVQFTAGL
jgi:hypothetical protein